jgi:hypothetical protein
MESTLGYLITLACIWTGAYLSIGAIKLKRRLEDSLHRYGNGTSLHR